jgi:hypothetical protein
MARLQAEVGVMGWRDKYKVHPAADVFPMMSDEELSVLGADIKKSGLKVPLLFWSHDGVHVLLDGRNRLEAMDRAGVEIDTDRFGLPDKYRGANAAKSTNVKDPVGHIISLNIRRRHLTKQQQADLIVAAIKAGEKPPQLEEVSKGGRGKVNPVKAKAVAAGAEHGISKATVERSLAKADGKPPRKSSGPSAEEIAANELAWAEAQADLKRSVDEVMAIIDDILHATDPRDIQRLAELLWDEGVHIEVQDQIDRRVYEIEEMEREVEEEIEAAREQAST